MNDQDGYGLHRIKNDLRKLLGSDAPKEIDELDTHFREFDSQSKQKLSEIYVLRKKAMAHSDWEAVFGDLDNSTKVSDVVEMAEAVMNLVKKLCSVFSKTRSHTFEGRCSLSIHHEAIAAHDAVKFWEHSFEVWAK